MWSHNEGPNRWDFVDKVLASHQEAGCPGGGGENLREPRNHLWLILRGKQNASHLLFQEKNGKRDRAAYGRVSLLDGGGFDGASCENICN